MDELMDESYSWSNTECQQSYYNGYATIADVQNDNLHIIDDEMQFKSNGDSSYSYDDFTNPLETNTKSILSSLINNVQNDNRNVPDDQELEYSEDFQLKTESELDLSSVSLSLQSDISLSDFPSGADVDENEDENKLEQSEKNLIILDWDDTLFPTTSFRFQQYKKDHKFLDKLSILVGEIEVIFEKMINLYGAENIVIVTNAKSSWIEKCLNVDIAYDIFNNFNLNILQKFNISTISASELFKSSQKFPHDRPKWKEIAFNYLFNEHFADDNNAINRIVSIGDSSCEYNASYVSSKHIKNRILHRIRFKSNPSIDDLITQIRHIIPIIPQFGEKTEDIDIRYY